MRTKERLIQLKQMLSLRKENEPVQAVQQELNIIDNTSTVIQKRLDDLEYVLGEYSPYQAMLDVIRHDLRRIEQSSTHIKIIHQIPKTDRLDPPIVRRVEHIIVPNN